MSRRIKSGMALPTEVVSDIRHMRRNGTSYTSIATQMNVSRTSVRRYCSDLPELKVVKMTSAERSELLSGWRDVTSLFTGWPEDGV